MDLVKSNGLSGGQRFLRLLLRTKFQAAGILLAIFRPKGFAASFLTK
jgi:hypothetical protein